MVETPFKLDEYDKRILYELDRQSNMPLSALARKIKKSKQFVLFRQSRLEKAGVITGYTAIVDMAKLGYFSFRIYLKFKGLSQKGVDAVIEYAKTLPNVWTVTLLHGKWDLAIFTGAKKMSDLHSVWDSIMDAHKNNIEKYNLALYAPIYNFNRTFFLDNEREVDVREYGNGAPLSLGKDYERVILAYAPDVRQSMLSLGKKLGMSPETVRKKIAELERKKVICGYKIGLDQEKLGYVSYRLDFELSSTEKYQQLFEYCKRHKGIYQVQKTIGHMDFETEIVVRDLKELLGTIEEIKVKFSDVVVNADYFGYSTYHLLNYIPD